MIQHFSNPEKCYFCSTSGKHDCSMWANFHSPGLGTNTKVQYRLQCRRQPWRIHKAVLTPKSLQPDCSWCFKQLFQSSSAWDDLKASDWNTDIPKNKCLRASVKVYLELLCDIINYGYLSLSLRQHHMGPKGKCKVAVWQFDVIITGKGLKRSTLPNPLSNWMFCWRDIYRYASVFCREKKRGL